jgi:hypothetical protein
MLLHQERKKERINKIKDARVFKRAAQGGGCNSNRNLKDSKCRKQALFVMGNRNGQSLHGP